MAILKIALCCLAYLIPTFTFVAQVPDEWNLNFEYWEGTDSTPALWHDTTVVENRQGLFPPKWHYDPDHIPEGIGLGQTTDATAGDYAVALSGYYQYEVMKIIAGEDPTHPGWPIDFRPVQLIGDYKAILLGDCDSLRTTIKVQLTAFDELNEHSEIIAESMITLKESEEYVQFNLPIDYSTELVPDTVIIELSKQRFGFDAPPDCLECSHVFFDNLHLSQTVTSIADWEETIDVEIAPNPTSDILNFSVNNKHTDLSIELQNLNGQVLKRLEIMSNHGSFNIAELPAGMYKLTVKNAKNQTLAVRKISKQ